MKILKWMDQNQQDLNTWTDTITKVAQVVAVVLAGIWTLHVFGTTEKPSLEFSGTSAIDLHWYAGSQDSTCKVVVGISMKNDGRTAFTVEQMWVRAWYFHLSQVRAIPTAGQPSLVDNAAILSQTPVFNASYTAAQPLMTLVTHYPPGRQIRDELVFEVLREPEQMVLFKVDVRTANFSEQSQFVPSAWASDKICDY